MILITLTDGAITKSMAYSKRLIKRNEGYEYDGTFYSSDLVKVPSIEITAKDGGISKDGEGQFSIAVLKSESNYDSVVDFSSKDLSVTVKVWSEESSDTPFTIFSGRAYLGAMDKDNYTYKLKREKGELLDDLLIQAPDIRQNSYLDADKSFYFETTDQGGNWDNTYLDNRFFPMRLGIIKHSFLFQLALNAPVTVPADSVGEYYADGSVYGLFDNGLSIQYEQYTSDYRVLKNKAGTQAVYELTMDIDGDDLTVKSDTVSLEILPLNHIFRQNSEPSKTIADEFGLIYDLRTGMVWYDTDNDNKSFRWGGSSWEIITVTVTSDIIATDAVTTDAIATDAVNSDSIAPSVTLQDGAIESSDFVDIPTGAGFRLKSGALGTSADPTIFGAYVVGGVINGSVIKSENYATNSLFLINEKMDTQDGLTQDGYTTIPATGSYKYSWSNITGVVRQAEIIGDTSIAVNGTLVQLPSIGRLIKFSNHATEYLVVDGSETTLRITIEPPLTSALAVSDTYTVIDKWISTGQETLWEQILASGIQFISHVGQMTIGTDETDVKIEVLRSTAFSGSSGDTYLQFVEVFNSNISTDPVSLYSNGRNIKVTNLSGVSSKGYGMILIS